MDFTRRTFESIEQLDELPAEMGWPLQYRQLETGSFSSTFNALDGPAWFLMEEQTSRTVEVQAGSPEGMYMLAVVQGGTATINGQEFSGGHVLVQSPNSNFRATIYAGARVTQLGVLAADFERMVSAVALEQQVPEGVLSIPTSAPGLLAQARLKMRASLQSPPRQGATLEESVSCALSQLIMASLGAGQALQTRNIHTAAASRTLDRARDYIDANLDKPVRIDQLQQYSGANIRSLERIFRKEMGVSPQQYVKARRLNAARRSLLAADPEEGLNVTGIAVSYGFSHLSRFSGEYARFFGESPRDTLQTRPSSTREANGSVSYFG